MEVWCVLMNKISWGWVPIMKNTVFWKTELTQSHHYTTSRKRSLGSGSCGRYYEMGGSSVWTGMTRSSSPTKPRLGLLCKWYQIGSLGLVMFFLCGSFKLEHICGSFPSTFKFARCRDSSQPAKEGIHFSQTLAGLLKEVAGLEYMAFFW